jgi:hypothetical protein
VGRVWGIGERTWGGDFRRRMMIFDTTARGRDLGIEGTRRGRECARKIFERGASSTQRNASEGRLRGID